MLCLAMDAPFSVTVYVPFGSVLYIIIGSGLFPVKRGKYEDPIAVSDDN
jgi:hypothetical protein